MLELLFTGPVLASLGIAASTAFAVAVVLRYLPDRRRLDHTVARAEAALARLRQEIAGKEATIRQLQSEVEMLKPLYGRLDGYHEALTQLRLQAERQELEREAAAGDHDDDLFERHHPTPI